MSRDRFWRQFRALAEEKWTVLTFWGLGGSTHRLLGGSTLIVNQSRRETNPSQWTSSTASVKWASCAKNTAMYFLLKAALLLFLQAGKRMHTGSTTIRGNPPDPLQKEVFWSYQVFCTLLSKGFLSGAIHYLNVVTLWQLKPKVWMMNKRYCLREWGMIHLKTIVCPASKFHLAVLVVKREPRDVN